MNGGLRIESRPGGILAACFDAMASPCEVLLETDDQPRALHLGRMAAAEALRIEAKFSRYRDDSVIGRINRSGGVAQALDPETAGLMDFAARCHQLSGGAFDVTSGVLRRIWRFDGRGRFPAPEAVTALLRNVGFDKLAWRSPWLTVPAGMELDFGGIGKEYAVDRVLALISQEFPGAALVNFGGDLAAGQAPVGAPWSVGVERPGSDRDARLLLDFTRGGLATSGDTHRYLVHDGERYSHILDVRSGYPVRGAPRSVTVAAATCVEAGLLATLAMLQGEQAESFLADQGVRHWILR
jgi:FAD:protein FMN transferase